MAFVSRATHLISRALTSIPEINFARRTLVASSSTYNNNKYNYKTSICSCCVARASTPMAIEYAPVQALQMRQVHSKSQGDNQFLEFLDQEIKSEREDVAKEKPTFSDFKVTPDGPNVKLTRQINGEVVTIDFNVTNSVTTMEDEAEDSTAAPEMVSQPAFTVTLTKEGVPQKLAFRCELINDAMEEDASEEKDSYEIVEVAMVNGEEWNEDTTYSVSAELLDPNMYDMLMLVLEERGITHEGFCSELEQFSTEYEHDRYIEMLESLKDFIKV